MLMSHSLRHLGLPTEPRMFYLGNTLIDHDCESGNVCQLVPGWGGPEGPSTTPFGGKYNPLSPWMKLSQNEGRQGLHYKHLKTDILGGGGRGSCIPRKHPSGAKFTPLSPWSTICHKIAG